MRTACCRATKKGRRSEYVKEFVHVTHERHDNAGHRKEEEQVGWGGQGRSGASLNAPRFAVLTSKLRKCWISSQTKTKLKGKNPRKQKQSGPSPGDCVKPLREGQHQG